MAILVLKLGFLVTFTWKPQAGHLVRADGAASLPGGVSGCDECALCNLALKKPLARTAPGVTRPRGRVRVVTWPREGRRGHSGWSYGSPVIRPELLWIGGFLNGFPECCRARLATPRTTAKIVMA